MKGIVRDAILDRHVTVAEVLSGSRKTHIVAARWHAIQVMDAMGFPLWQLRRFFNLDNRSIYYALNRNGSYREEQREHHRVAHIQRKQRRGAVVGHDAATSEERGCQAQAAG